MKGQIVTFDAIFAFLLIVSAMLFLSGFEADLSPLEELVLERKATDFVRFLYEEKGDEIVVGMGVLDLSEGIGKVDAAGVEFDGIVVGEKPGRFRTKYLLVPVFNSTEFRTVRVDVW